MSVEGRNNRMITNFEIRLYFFRFTNKTIYSYDYSDSRKF
jgi:hypothetical protein